MRLSRFRSPIWKDSARTRFSLSGPWPGRSDAQVLEEGATGCWGPVAEDSERLAHFMGYFNSELAREVSRSTGWRDKVFSRRYQAILISDEEEAQVGRLTYVLSHGC